MLNIFFLYIALRFWAINIDTLWTLNLLEHSLLQEEVLFLTSYALLCRKIKVEQSLRKWNLLNFCQQAYLVSSVCSAGGILGQNGYLSTLWRLLPTIFTIQKTWFYNPDTKQNNNFPSNNAISLLIWLHYITIWRIENAEIEDTELYLGT